MGGIGAGLSIVQRIVVAHGGRIRIERSEALGGARFVVEIPTVGTTTFPDAGVD
jgi:two-component system sensor histidine kinase RstB